MIIKPSKQSDFKMNKGGSIKENKLLPEKTLPDGHSLLLEGYKSGEKAVVGRSAFMEGKDYISEADYKKEMAEQGKITWSMIMGLSSLDEQLDALKYIHEYGQQYGVVIDRGLIIPNSLTGLPESLRGKCPKGTSFILEEKEDWNKISKIAPIQPCFNDWHIGSPNAVMNTLNAVEAGGSYHGVLAQYAWDFPYFDDDIDLIAQNIKAIGIIASKKDDHLIVDSYLDDGMPSYFKDYVSFIAYARLERYVVETLCGARYATGFGQLIGDIPTKIAIWLALDDVLKTDLPGLSYIYGNTIDKTEDRNLLISNYGMTVAECLPFVVAEQKFKTGVSILPNPATEKIQVPTREDIAQVHTIARIALDKADEFEKILNFQGIIKMRDVLVEKGNRFFKNILEGLPKFNVNIEDPLQVLLSIRRLGATNLENLFHPRRRKVGADGDIEPFFPTEMIQMQMSLEAEELEEIGKSNRINEVGGKTIVIGSADAHSFGYDIILNILRKLGAHVIDGGVGLDPENVVDLVEKNAASHAAISIHNGQCVDYAKRLVELKRKRSIDAAFFLGGKLNTIGDGNSCPIDAVDILKRLGVIPCKNIKELVDHF